MPIDASLSSNRTLYLGMISGTSIDGIDVVLVDFSDSSARLIAADTFPYATELKNRLQALLNGQTLDLIQFGKLDVALGHAFADAAIALLESVQVRSDEVCAIGHHGQTVYHLPTGDLPFTLQIGDPNIVAARTGTTTVADFRRLDMAFGGQGAPLVPAFHDWLFRSPDETRVILNIGGIANITVLSPQHATTGFDTGPGNTLMDAWINNCLDQPFDQDGAWAATGSVHTDLLAALQDDDYFRQQAPKSTGREYFNLDWLQSRITAIAEQPNNQDIQATLSELTAITISEAIADTAANCKRVIVCGGGAHNADLLRRLANHLQYKPETSNQHGIDPDWVEGLAFAWLARGRLRQQATNVPSVTGARKAVTLGGIYSPGAHIP